MSLRINKLLTGGANKFPNTIFLSVDSWEDFRVGIGGDFLTFKEALKVVEESEKTIILIKPVYTNQD